LRVLPGLISNTRSAAYEPLPDPKSEELSPFQLQEAGRSYDLSDVKAAYDRSQSSRARAPLLFRDSTGAFYAAGTEPGTPANLRVYSLPWQLIAADLSKVEGAESLPEERRAAFHWQRYKHSGFRFLAKNYPDFLNESNWTNLGPALVKSPNIS